MLFLLNFSRLFTFQNLNRIDYSVYLWSVHSNFQFRLTLDVQQCKSVQFFGHFEFLFKYEIFKFLISFFHKMKNLFVLLLVCVAICYSRALEHNLFYGNCVHDDQTIQLYSQIVMMNNSNTIQNSKSRKWYDWFSFNRKTTPSPRFSRKVINATIQFPPAVSRFHLIID